MAPFVFPLFPFHSSWVQALRARVIAAAAASIILFVFIRSFVLAGYRLGRWLAALAAAAGLMLFHTRPRKVFFVPPALEVTNVSSLYSAALSTRSHFGDWGVP